MKKSIFYSIIKTTYILCITVIGFWGIVTAPAKNNDTETLRHELEQNKTYLSDMQTDNNFSTTEPQKTEKPIQTAQSTVTVIGDSVTLGASRSICETIPNCMVDAEESRQVKDALPLLEVLEEEGKLGDTVIIALGINGYFYESTGQEIIDYLGTDRTIYWINLYGQYLESYSATNKVIAALTEHNDNLFLIDWESEGKKHADWFYTDGVHLNSDGQQGFADFIYSNIQK